jgi:hypothetical protein
MLNAQDFIMFEYEVHTWGMSIFIGREIYQTRIRSLTNSIQLRM